MTKNKFGELIFDSNDICGLFMQGCNPTQLRNVIVDASVDIETAVHLIEDPGQLLTWQLVRDCSMSVPEFDLSQQANWHMPDEYRHMDIAAHVLELCTNSAQLQRAGEELLLFQQHDLFDLLRYLKYLVDIMRDNRVIWGVGRGSSVASYVLYLLGVHRIDSMYYDLDPREFLR
jgi:hypothetical protein